MGRKAAAGSEAVAGPGDVDRDLLDADFENVAGFGFGDGDGAGEDMAAGTFVARRDLRVDVADVLRDVGRLDADLFEVLRWAAGGEGLDGDGVAGVDGENGGGFRGVEPPGDGFGGGEEGLGLLGKGSRRDEEGDDAEGGWEAWVAGHGSGIAQA